MIGGNTVATVCFNNFKLSSVLTNSFRTVSCPDKCGRISFISRVRSIHESLQEDSRLS
jgi:hypothetical protein